MAYDNTDGGAIFKNKRKEHHNQPDHTGIINWHGEDIRIALWANTSKGGEDYFAVKLSEPKEQSGEGATQNGGAWAEQRAKREAAKAAATDGTDAVPQEDVDQTPPQDKPGFVPDEVIEDIGDDPINLDDIPF